MAPLRAALVTGSAGYIGRQLVHRLSRAGVRTVGIDRVGRGRTGELRFSLEDGPRLKRVLHRLAPDLVVHAGTHSFAAYREDFPWAFHEDEGGLASLLAGLRELPRTRLVFFSSSYVYAGITASSVGEGALLALDSSFGAGKLVFERLIQHSHPESVVFRLSSVYGPGAGSNQNAIAGMARECRSTGVVTVWGAGARRMQYVYVDDVIDHCLGALDVPPGVYNLGGEEYIPVAEAAARLARSLGGRVAFDSTRTEGLTLPRMSVGKLRDASGRDPTPFVTGLGQYAEYLRTLRAVRSG